MFEAYKIGVTVSLINRVSPGLNNIIAHLGKAHGDVEALKNKLNGLKMMGMAGAGVAGLGFMGLGVIGKTLKPASEYVHQIALMNTAGMKHLEIVNATKAAWSAINEVPTSSVTENLAAIRDLRMVFGDTRHATEYMPVLQKIQGMLGTVRHGEGQAKSESYELAKALEIKGAVKNPGEFVHAADQMTKAIIATGGKVGASDFLSAFKYGRAATSGWNDDFTYKILPTLIQELKVAGGSGGSSGGAGPGLMSAYAAVVGGSVTQRALQVWQKLGLVDPKKIVWTKDGHAKGVMPGGIVGSDLFQASPDAWTRQVLLPAMNKNKYTSETQQKEVLQYLFPNRSAGFIMTQLALQGWKFDRDRKLIGQASGLAGYNDLLKNDPVMAGVALQKQWNSLLAILGFQIMPPFLTGLRAMISLTQGVIGWVRENQGFVKSLMWSFTALSAAMAFSGTVITLTAGFKAMQLVLPLLTAAGSGSSVFTLVTLLGKGGLVAAAGAAGYAVGTLINKLLDKGVEKVTGQKGNTLGGAFWDWQHGPNGPMPHRDSSNPRWNGIPETVAPGKGAKVQVRSPIYLDGKKIADVVTNHQANQADKPQGGANPFDGILSPNYGY